VKTKTLLLLVLVSGCVQPGVQRPIPDHYVVDVPGLFLVDSEAFAASEVIAGLTNASPCLNHSTVMLYYSEFNDKDLSNYVVRVVLNESGLNCLEYYESSLNDQHSWFFNNGLIIIEGTYSGYGSIEYNETLLEALVVKYQEVLSEVEHG
jgi:hypothetical protein